MKNFILLLVSWINFYNCYSQPSIKDLEANTFKIIVFKKNAPIKTGSGVVGFTVIKNGTEKLQCFTNAHVLDGGDSAVAVFKGETIPILNVCSINYEIDYALFDLPKTLIRRSGLLKKTDNKSITAELEKGNKVYTMSSPRGLEYSYTDGVISSIRMEKNYSLIQFTSPISPGSSGGALVNKDGELLGIISSQLQQSQNINFAISIHDILISIKGSAELNLKLAMLENYKNSSNSIYTKINDLLKSNNNDEAYKLILANYELVSKSWGLMYSKLYYEQERKLYNSFIETLQDFTEIHGFQFVAYVYLNIFFSDMPSINHSDLISYEIKLKRLYEKNSNEIIFEALLGHISYIIKDYNTAISHLSRFTIFYSEKEDGDSRNNTLPPKIGIYSDIPNNLLLPTCYELLGDSWTQLNNVSLAKEAYFKATTGLYSQDVTSVQEKHLGLESLNVEYKKDLWRCGYKAMKAYSESDDLKMACFIYNRMLRDVDPDGKNSEIYKACK